MLRQRSRARRAATLFGLCAAGLAGAAAAAPAGLPDGIQARPRGDGWAFADAQGMSLYTLDRDEAEPGASTCKDDCALAWPPLPAPAGSKGAGDWSVIARADGSLQWAYRGRPLYRYSGDETPGASFGDGAETQWHLAFQPIATPREVRIGRSVLGSLLTDVRGRTLYGHRAACDRDCLRTWEPLVAPALAQGFGDWSIVALESGLRQWAYKGQPLYRRPADDVRPGEISGQGAPGWTVMVLEPAPPLPSWATIQHSDAGDLIATQDGRTVYAHDVSTRRRRAFVPAGACTSDDCVDAEWVPLLAAADARAIGSWTLVVRKDGRRQWAYKGQRVYTNAADRRAGEFKGLRFGGDRTWAAIMRSGEPMQGVSVGG